MSAKKLAESPPSTLPQLVSKANLLAEKLIESGGELDPVTEAALTVNEKELALKVDAYAVIMDRFKFEADFYKAKAKEMQAHAKAIENAAERLKNNLKFALKTLGQSEVSGIEYRFKLTNSKPKLLIDEALLPDEFKTQVVSYEPDKDKIHDALNSGLTVKGCALEESVALRKYVAKAGAR